MTMDEIKLVMKGDNCAELFRQWDAAKARRMPTSAIRNSATVAPRLSEAEEWVRAREREFADSLKQQARETQERRTLVDRLVQQGRDDRRERPEIRLLNSFHEVGHAFFGEWQYGTYSYRPVHGLRLTQRGEPGTIEACAYIKDPPGASARARLAVWLSGPLAAGLAISTGRVHGVSRDDCGFGHGDLDDARAALGSDFVAANCDRTSDEVRAVLVDRLDPLDEFARILANRGEITPEEWDTMATGRGWRRGWHEMAMTSSPASRW